MDGSLVAATVPRARSCTRTIGRHIVRAAIQISRSSVQRILREEADAKYREIKTMSGQSERTRGKQRISRENYGRAEAELKELVDEGKVSGKDARARLGAMRRMMAEQHEERGDVDWDAIKKRIEGAVERGDLTREQAIQCTKRSASGWLGVSNCDPR